MAVTHVVTKVTPQVPYCFVRKLRTPELSAESSHRLQTKSLSYLMQGPLWTTFYADLDGILSSTQNKYVFLKYIFGLTSIMHSVQRTVPLLLSQGGLGRAKAFNPVTSLAVVHSQKLSRTIENYFTPKK